MKTLVNLILILFFLTNCASYQNTSSNFIGSWLYKGIEDNKKSDMECPDLIVFEKNGTYSILNDCYGEKIEKPLIEYGQWIFDNKSKKIILKKRKFITNYFFHDSATSLTLFVKEISNKSLKIYFNEKSIVENYEKVLGR